MANTLDINVSFYSNIKTVKPTEINLFEILTNNKYKNEVIAIRQETNVEKQKEMKYELPLFTPAGLFNNADAKSIIMPTGLIGIDIDKKDNQDVEDFSLLKEKIGIVPYVLYCGWSVRGEGYLCIMQITDSNKFKEHFLSIQQDFDQCNVTIDRSGSNINRRRFVSYDPEPYINLEAKVYDKILDCSTFGQNVSKSYHNDGVLCINTDVAIEIARIISVISSEEIDITESYENWFPIGCSLANSFGEQGRSMFHAISKYYKDYDPSETDFKFDEALAHNYNYGLKTFFYHAKQAGIDISPDFRSVK